MVSTDLLGATVADLLDNRMEAARTGLWDLLTGAGR